MRPRNRNLLACHTDRLIGAETSLQSRIRLDVELITQTVVRIDVGRGCNGSAVAGIHRRKSRRNGREGIAIEGSEAAQFAEHPAPP
jgi:hypothetical protein